MLFGAVSDTNAPLQYLNFTTFRVTLSHTISISCVVYSRAPSTPSDVACHINNSNIVIFVGGEWAIHPGWVSAGLAYELGNRTSSAYDQFS
ncbi:unnamed protein product [Leptidea sinapis]|uniref:Uncharacterized protein n=1 Tax=Leptidea sinapis TaxID=189913 RepID=A0A5E4QRG3_9NEOP|nr:unnamed protein product [Leptidea sinapis]